MRRIQPIAEHHGNLGQIFIQVFRTCKKAPIAYLNLKDLSIFASTMSIQGLCYSFDQEVALTKSEKRQILHLNIQG